MCVRQILLVGLLKYNVGGEGFWRRPIGKDIKGKMR